MLLLTRESPLLYLLGMAVLLLLAEGLCRWVPFFRKLHSPNPAGSSRFETLDGLRGILATGVLFHHALIFDRFWQTGQWQRSPSIFFSALGPCAVALFFMITGFLFWGKAIRNQGKIKVVELYVGRLWRLGPAYLTVAAAIILIVAAETHFHLQIGLKQLVLQLAHVLALGGASFEQLNGVNTRDINAGVTWTLMYEWRFYLALPLLALCATPRRFVPLATAVVLAYAVTGKVWAWCLLNFAIGMGTAHLTNWSLGRRLAEHKWAVLVPILVAALALAKWGEHNLLLSIALGALFLLIVHGSDLGGLLRWRATRCLGTVSYSVYLCHGVVLYLVLGYVNAMEPLGRIPTGMFWLLVIGCAALTTLISAVLYRWCEHPFLRPVRRSARPQAEPCVAASLPASSPAG